MKKPVPHGTANGYQNYDCRCAACKVAMSVYTRERHTVACAGGCGGTVWTIGKGRSGLCPKCSGAARRTAPCGTESAYDRGCRCDLCRAAATTARRRRRHANPEATRAYDREYKRQRRAAA